ncbi:N-6 DNA methylase [Tissierella creatinophila]|uniref:site-specific DNA-methyltransferase (adenine-specific) n=1 Tax=Tissierella creatinophila DSM 6911 TaxID=1123403 RepID=A0A1U7M5K2_TISCR|nr:N-6 DNA methylase [Tissierella creatinophila]OLS02593.1 N-6 DNA methylase [Tissierella creatinophila DSM 6911]
MNETKKKLIKRYISQLRGVFNQEQAFNIVLGILFIKWMEQSDRYGDSVYLITKPILDNENPENSIRYYEADFPEIAGILSTLLSKSFVDEKIDLKEVYWSLSNKEFKTKHDLRDLINIAVQDGLEVRNFNETPNSIASLVVNLVEGNRIDSFADYCSGISNIALEVFRKTDCQPYYYAEEINTTIALISKLLMIVNEVESYEIINKDIFTKRDKEEVKEFDLVVCDMPRISRYDRQFRANDPRFRYGAPGKANPEWAFIQNIIYHLNEQGKGIAIGSKGMLVRGFEKDVRSRIVKEDLIEAVITLPDNLYEGTNIGTEIIILNRDKPVERQGLILFINAHEYGVRLNRNQYSLTEEGRKKILDAYYNGMEEEGFSKLIPLEKIQEYEYRLNPVEYIDFETLKNKFEETIALDKIVEITRGLSLSRNELEELEAEEGYYFISVRNIDESGINYEDASRIKPKSNEWLERYSVEPEDILITTKGWETKVTLVGTNFKNLFFSSNLTRIRVDRNKYNPYILVEFLKSKIGKRMLESIQTGTTVTLINNKQLSRMEVPVYSEKVMYEIGNAMEDNHKTYEHRIREAEREYEGKRKELMERLGINSGL